MIEVAFKADRRWYLNGVPVNFPLRNDCFRRVPAAWEGKEATKECGSSTEETGMEFIEASS
jgi:hypothetical protein